MRTIATVIATALITLSISGGNVGLGGLTSFNYDVSMAKFNRQLGSSMWGMKRDLAVITRTLESQRARMRL